MLFSTVFATPKFIKANDFNNELEISYNSSNKVIEIFSSSGKEVIQPYFVYNSTKYHLKNIPIAINENLTTNKIWRNTSKWGIKFNKASQVSEAGFDINFSENIIKIDNNSDTASIYTKTFSWSFKDLIDSGFGVNITKTGIKNASIKITGLPNNGTVNLDPITIKTGGAATDAAEPANQGLEKDGQFYYACWLNGTAAASDINCSGSVDGGTTWSVPINLSQGGSLGQPVPNASRIFNLIIDRNAKKLHLLYNNDDTTAHYYYMTSNYRFDQNSRILEDWSEPIDLNFIVPKNVLNLVFSQPAMDINSTGSVFISVFTQIGAGNREVALIHADGNTEDRTNWISDSNAVFTNTEFNPTLTLALDITNDQNVNIVGAMKPANEFLRLSVWNTKTRTFLIQDKNVNDSCRGVAGRCYYVSLDHNSNGHLFVRTGTNTNGEIIRYDRNTDTFLTPINTPTSYRQDTFTMDANDNLFIASWNTDTSYRILYDKNGSLSGENQLETDLGYFRYFGNIDSNNSLEMRYIDSTTGNVKLTRITSGVTGFAVGGGGTPNTKPDANLWQVDGFDFNATLPTFSYFRDKNLTITFWVRDAEQNDLNANLWYGTSSGAKTTRIFGDLNLSTNFGCDGNNSANGMVCSKDWNISAMADGNYFLVLDTNDKQDINSYNSPKSFMIDNTAPSVGATTLTGFTISTTFIKGTGTIIGGAATDTSSGIDTTTCEYTATGAWVAGAWNTNHCEKTLFATANGTVYTFNTRVKDRTTNQGTGTATIAYTGDTTAPTTTATGCTSNWHNSNQTVTLTCDDGVGAGCLDTRYRIDVGAWTDYTIPFVISTDGNHQIDFNSSDNVQNEEAAIHIHCDIDKTKPTATFSGDHNSWKNTNQNITLICVDATSGQSTFRYRQDSNENRGIAMGAWIDYTIPLVYTVDGNWSLDFNCTDQAGNIGDTNTKYVLLDKTKPTMAHENFLAPVIYSQTLRFDLNTQVSTNNGDLNVSVDDVNNAVFNFATNCAENPNGYFICSWTEPLLEGDHTLKIYSRDQAQNTNQANYSFHYSPSGSGAGSGTAGGTTIPTTTDTNIQKPFTITFPQEKRFDKNISINILSKTRITIRNDTNNNLPIKILVSGSLVPYITIKEHKFELMPKEEKTVEIEVFVRDTIEQIHGTIFVQDLSSNAETIIVNLYPKQEPLSPIFGVIENIKQRLKQDAVPGVSFAFMVAGIFGICTAYAFEKRFDSAILIVGIMGILLPILLVVI